MLYHDLTLHYLYFLIRTAANEQTLGLLTAEIASRRDADILAATRQEALQKQLEEERASIRETERRFNERMIAT